MDEKSWTVSRENENERESYGTINDAKSFDGPSARYSNRLLDRATNHGGQGRCSIGFQADPMFYEDEVEHSDSDVVAYYTGWIAIFVGIVIILVRISYVWTKNHKM